MICKIHVPVKLTIDIEGKKYPNLTYSGNPMIRCTLCDCFGEIKDNEFVWGLSREERLLQEETKLKERAKLKRQRQKEVKEKAVKEREANDKRKTK